MKKIFFTILFILIFININSQAGEPNVLQCKKNCGTPDIDNEFTCNIWFDECCWCIFFITQPWDWVES